MSSKNDTVTSAVAQDLKSNKNFTYLSDFGTVLAISVLPEIPVVKLIYR